MSDQTFTSRLKSAWNAFFSNKDPTPYEISTQSYGGYSYRPDRFRTARGIERSIIVSIYNRISLDCAAIDIKHVRLDDDGRYLEDVDSGLNNCLTLEANTDQIGRALIQDAVMSMLDEGCVAIVPVDTTKNPTETEGYDILSLRTAKILEWFSQTVRLRIYCEQTGKQEEIVLPKSMVAIIENPFYAVMNEPNSTMQRLIKKLSLMDAIDEQSGSNKLDLIIQLPYQIKTPAKREYVKSRMDDIQSQLDNSKYGIAYTDVTEKVMQLNRPIENNLMSQVEYLTSMLYSQLGLTQGILDGTADERTMQNYYNRTIEPILSALTNEMERKFLSKKARGMSPRQSVEFFRDPFKLVPVSAIAEIADKFTRNEIMTSNEIRQVIGMKPSRDPKADELRNSNLSAPASDQEGYPMQMMPEEEQPLEEYPEEQQINEEEIQNGNEV